LFCGAGFQPAIFLNEAGEKSAYNRFAIDLTDKKIIPKP